MIVVTAATGHLGRLAVTALLDRGVPADRIVAAVRNPDKAADLGVEVRLADYTRPETLATAFAGAEKVLLISSNAMGERLAQHRNAVDAAKAAGVGLLVYTSVLRADTTGLGLAVEHKATEEYITASGLPHVFLRNGWYLENYTENLAPALTHGALLGSAENGLVSAAARADYAAAAAVVLTTDAPAKIYELAGDRGFTMTELAAEVSRQSGKEIAYRDLPQAEYFAALTGAGVPEQYADLLADSDVGVAKGDLHASDTVLSGLIGRPTTSLADAVSVALKN
ncbi:SDR family oxidoreductase [Phytomonospora endophytica]|uniref:NAD(P)H dehydrogenase (Quinone) n=1 Tax=Phytomonospora endophytica TaxID=714109 RepID=A0A841FTH4_9ACTN|nr:SDR family oxidoreductase [Phytomonospora endophytica]MBB6039094.1 NAD(P)H dehydrogenase (quinone) [Phytomonospora endophytica]GIG65577.1 NAD(P)-dependent oxidoreductase [Phytomonospora endophytica]